MVSDVERSRREGLRRGGMRGWARGLRGHTTLGSWRKLGGWCGEYRLRKGVEERREAGVVDGRQRA
jgi:hypothetical protein